MQMVLLGALVASLLSTCRGAGGNSAVSQLLFPLQNSQVLQSKSLGMGLKKWESTI